MKHDVLDANGITSEGIELVHSLDLSKIAGVGVRLSESAYSAGYSGGPADLTLDFKDGNSVTIINGFGIGYGGTGPWGLHDILKNDFHLSEDESSRVFIPNTKILYFDIT